MYYTRFILGLLVAAPAAGQDVQSWNTLLVQGPVDGKLLLWAEGQPRLERFSISLDHSRTM